MEEMTKSPGPRTGSKVRSGFGSGSGKKWFGGALIILLFFCFFSSGTGGRIVKRDILEVVALVAHKPVHRDEDVMKIFGESYHVVYVGPGFGIF